MIDVPGLHVFDKKSSTRVVILLLGQIKEKSTLVSTISIASTSPIPESNSELGKEAEIRPLCDKEVKWSGFFVNPATSNNLFA